MTDETAELHPPGLTMSRREALQATAGAVAFAALPLPAEAAADSTATPAPPTHTLPLEVTVNGRAHQLVVDPRLSVLDMLRERLSLTGTKKGCNQGACGACTVLIDGQRVNACLALAVMYDGAKITTIEGVAEGEALHPLQVAFIEHDAFQCGYCTSGQIMSGLGCISEGHASSAEEISYWMSGNICRCGAYPGIVAAVAQAAKEDRT
ncbi:(2Fe-2S)-binding protein [Sinorhizobium meliloti]|jgi:xanthine dehydrogenase YagT iron-sulfur-binding subunit|uniref:(2Fe-2S)-binding protein n=1 Tax=Rhizobium meliloti TaxID=382 RepID=UPI000481F18F|nr:(2Fe-2S)-binding protein [Sinorhizobium meliloti]MDE3821681.1 (2Fe-2S)-binding protein [Sinorhizobium meliloti]MDE4616595.1 (2Fe-2S)-binding protein [Sinorhizobium meliloti]RMI18158.1 (2Fe-2S)-binding protein [Sinorhizobium meliloti]RVG56339.1 (2Fe-2S)-binding protein [Sinorhizobium meliloti]RVH23184.1 (2Fe-2S)-binding protein [Sinorhizobium meliloti]